MTKIDYNENGIGEWSEIKLQCIKKYLGAYTNIMHYGRFPEFYFLDLFASEGICRSRKTDKLMQGSPLISLSVKPSFSRYFFCELDKEKIRVLQNIRDESPLKNKIEIFDGDCNEKVDEMLASIKISTPFIALLDPQAGDLHWSTIEKISKFNKSEILINFPFGMAINRYMPLSEGGDLTVDLKNKLNEIFGNDKWELIYKERIKNSIGPDEARKKYLKLYLTELISLGYKYYAVKDLRNSKNAHLYYLIFGTKNRKGLEKMKDAFVEGEKIRNNLFFKQDLTQKMYKVFKDFGTVNLDVVLERLLSGTHSYKVQDFKEALKALEKENKLVRTNFRKNARSFNMEDSFKIV